LRVPSSSQRDFHEFATEGVSIATARLERAQLDEILRRLKDEFGLHIAPPDDFFERLLTGLRFAAGRYWHETQTVERAEIASRLRTIRRAAEEIGAILQAIEPFDADTYLADKGPGPGSASGIIDQHDFAALTLLKEAFKDHNVGATDEQAHAGVEAMLAFVRDLHLCCRKAEAKLKAMRSKKGQRGLAWYDHFTALMVEAAQVLGIPVKTGGDRASAEPDKTPFTIFAFALEKSLPAQARAKSLSSCAKRLRRSLANSRTEDRIA
jgi:hypothetical protein